MKKILDFLSAHPAISHGLSAFYQVGLLTFLFVFIEQMKWNNPAVLAFIVVSAFYYGREAGQREHDLKNWYNTGRVVAAFGSDYLFKWSGSNFVQWLGAVIGGALMTALLLSLLIISH